MAFAVDLTGTILDRRYRLTGLLGKGGMGFVYEAVHVALDQRVAVKVLHPRYAYEERFRERFLQEARAASKIRHPNVVEIKDFGDTPDGSVYFAMEYLQGHDVGADLQEHGALPWARARHILLQAAGALGAAHAKHIIHRDIKPGNCFLIEDEAEGLVDVVKLLDFGIAKVGSDSHTDAQGKGLTGTGEVFGTASYMSPEQARGLTLDARSDMYSLGIMAYEMLVGQVPFTGVNAIHVITQHLRDRPEPLRAYDQRIAPVVEALVLRMIAKEPRDRYASMAELEQALREIPEDAGARRTRLWSSPGELRALVAGKKAGGAAAGPSTPMAWAAAAEGDGDRTDTDAERTEAVVPVAKRGAVKRRVSSTDRPPIPAARVASSLPPPPVVGAAVAAAPRARAVAPPSAPASGEGGRSSATAPAVPSVAVRARAVTAPVPVAATPVAAAPAPVVARAPAATAPVAAAAVVPPAGAAALPPVAAALPPTSASAASPALVPGFGAVPPATNPPPGRDASASTWPPSTASTGPQVRFGDTGTETRPHSLEAVGAPGISARLLLVVGLLVVLVGGVSVGGTVVFLKREQPEPAAESQPDAAVEEAALAGGQGGGGERAGEREAPVHEAAVEEAVVVPDVGTPSGVPGSIVEEGSSDAGIAGEVVDDEPTEEGEGSVQTEVEVEADPSEEPQVQPEEPGQPEQPAAPKLPKHETEKCARAREAAERAADQLKFAEAAKLAKQRECWSAAQQEDRRRIQVHSLLELDRFADCVAAGSKATDPNTKKMVETCRRKVPKQ